ncbi:hypothetical protein LSH36_315g04013 [Paralvinella palmiformis]|uniref:Uncharacterized protein n=1 Tax=Paralvinella palmiformis TaxID=53620 RepID=A0AAD9N0S0_9ANNE|nr:hypothetical protein LSH36_315g04013 [Paralvinella palmiformis]
MSSALTSPGPGVHRVQMDTNKLLKSPPNVNDRRGTPGAIGRKRRNRSFLKSALYYTSPGNRETISPHRGPGSVTLDMKITAALFLLVLLFLKAETSVNCWFKDSAFRSFRLCLASKWRRIDVSSNFKSNQKPRPKPAGRVVPSVKWTKY